MEEKGKERKNLKLSLRERKILYLLRLDARMSVTEVAKRVGCSREMVQYALNRLHKKKAIRKINLFVDFDKVGYEYYSVFIKFKCSSDEANKLVLKLRKVKGVLRTGYFFGSYDTMVYFYGKSVKEIEEIVSKIRKVIRNKVSKTSYQRMLYQKTLPYKAILTDQEIKSLGRINTKQKKKDNKLYQLTDEEKHFLRILYQKPDASILELSRKTKFSYKRTKSFFKSLQERDIITGFHIYARIGALNYNNLNVFEVLLNFSEDERNSKERFEEFLSHQSRYIIFLNRYLLGEFDYKLNFLATSANHLKSQLNELTLGFPENVEIIAILPFGIGEQDDLLRETSGQFKNLFKN